MEPSTEVKHRRDVACQDPALIRDYKDAFELDRGAFTVALVLTDEGDIASNYSLQEIPCSPGKIQGKPLIRTGPTARKSAKSS